MDSGIHLRPLRAERTTTMVETVLKVLAAVLATLLLLIEVDVIMRV
jgi:hypothetical protein